MKKRSDLSSNISDINQLIGLGASSKAKSYYPDLIKKLEELRLEKEKYQSIFINAQEGIFRATIDGIVTDMNPAMTRICCHGDPKTCVRHKFNFQGFFYDKFLWAKIIVTLKKDGSILGLETLLQQVSTPNTWVSLSLILNKDTDGKSIIEGIVEDITERKNAVDELRKTKSYLDNIINSMPSLLIGIDPAGMITSMNKEAETTSGIAVKDATGKPISQIFPAYQQFFDSFSTENPKQINHHKITTTTDKFEQHAAITTYPLISNGIQGTVVRIDDITEFQEKETQFQRVQKMQMVGVLAGGIAHDFNNLLTGSIGAVSMLKALVSSGSLTDEMLLKNLDIIENSASRSANMVQQLLTLSRKKAPHFIPCDLNQLIQQVVNILTNSLDKTIRLNTSFPTQPAIILADSSQVEQVLLNLCVNAGHAMTIMRDPDLHWGGDLNINLSLNEHYTQGITTKTSPHWKITIQDSGVGIKKEHLEKIFTPFFTTKKQDQGTGLGLSMAYPIINDHNGTLEIDSILNEGTTISLFFPMHESELVNKQHKAHFTLPTKQRGTILIIDDEDIVRDIASEILIACGYETISTASGKEGLAQYKKHMDKIIAIILDMSMPEMSGKEVYPKLLEINPQANIILCSGNYNDSRIQQLSQEHNLTFQAKPFSLEGLSSTIEKSLQRKV